MAIEISTRAIEEPATLPSQPELLVSAALHLMSHYSTRGDDAGTCLKLASVIERHLKALAGHGDLAPVLRATCQQLSEQWAGMVEQAIPARQNMTLLDRVFGVARQPS
jgi:hypothetical protein